MTKRSMMNAYYNRVAMHSAELALKFGIEEGRIHLDGNEIYGDTYRAKEAIKSYFDAKWNAEKKRWVIMKDLDFAELIFRDGLLVS